MCQLVFTILSHPPLIKYLHRILMSIPILLVKFCTIIFHPSELPLLKKLLNMKAPSYGIHSVVTTEPCVLDVSY